MKKIIRKALMVLALAGIGAGATSCDSDQVMQILGIVAQLMSGKTQTYVGQATVNAVGKDDVAGEDWLYTIQKDTLVSDVTCQIVVKQNVATLTIPSITIGGHTLTNVQADGISIKEDGNLEDGYCYYYTCERTVGGNTEQIAATEENSDYYNLALLNSKVVDDGNGGAKINLGLTIYAGTEAYNISFVGDYVQN